MTRSETNNTAGREREMSRFNLPNDHLDRPALGGNGKRRLHRIRTVRLRERLSLKSASRRLRLSMSKLRALEDESNDIRLSTLYAWQSVLGVPVSELVIDSGLALSEPIRQRACLVRMAKTAKTIQKKSRPDSTCPGRYAGQSIGRTHAGSE